MCENFMEIKMTFFSSLSSFKIKTKKTKIKFLIYPFRIVLFRKKKKKKYYLHNKWKCVWCDVMMMMTFDNKNERKMENKN